MGVKISNLPDIITPALTDVFPIVQDGITYKETITQLSTLIGSVATTTITGTANQVIASASVGPVTLSLPQSIATTSNVTFGSVTFSPTTGGIVGTTTNDSVAAGKVGEIIESEVLLASAVSLTSTVAANITSISLTAGQWLVWGNVVSNPNAATTYTVFAGDITTTSATLPTHPNKGAGVALQITFSTGNAAVLPVGQKILQLAATTTVYLVGYATFAVNTFSAYGYLGAMRVR